MDETHQEVKTAIGKAVRVIKGFLLALALLVVGNIAVQEYIHRDAYRQVIIAAYREHAMNACRLHAGSSIDAAAWMQPSDVRLTIGRSDLDVYLWQTYHRLWDARYRNAYMYVTIDDARAQIYCEYDIANDTAWVYQLGHVRNEAIANPLPEDSAQRM